jgi:bifunctional DNA-binding transcriptional regulator/antitoxin component of YhaV-PrlF toxin-antitoxin module
MPNIISTITSKWQVTIPEAVRKALLFKVGQRISWEVEGDKLVGRSVRTMSELAGCLKSGPAVDKKSESKAFVNAAANRHKRISRQKS